MGIAFSGLAFLLHEQNPWLFARAAFLHHVVGWLLIGASLILLARAFRPGSLALRGGFAIAVVALSLLLFADRDVAPVFGHLSSLAGTPHR